MRRAKRRAEHGACLKCSGKRMNRCHHEHLCFGKVGQKGGGGARKQGLPRSRRAVEGYVVRSCGGDDKAALRTLLPAYLVKGRVVVGRTRRGRLLLFSYNRFLFR